jgi:hypothetical protein
MPQRPREHRIEKGSRAAFADALGEDYRYPTEISDYSIDGGVEEFKDNHATGLRYLVQLKAADVAAVQALARSLPVETLQYYGGRLRLSSTTAPAAKPANRSGRLEPTGLVEGTNKRLPHASRDQGT